ncbi:MAG: BACON domain-containing carbohydrate-binding protein [Bryobacteraceae bacterium]
MRYRLALLPLSLCSAMFGAVTQQAYLKASNTQALDEFGRAVAISGDTAVVGAPEEDSNATGVNGTQGDNSAASAGAAYVFVRVAGTWTQQAYLKASNAHAGAAFGTSVAISGDTIVVGSPKEKTGGDGTGAAYVFVRSGSVWTQQATLRASNAEAGDEFGTSVAISGDTIVAGAPDESSNATGVNGPNNNNALISGAAYVFVRNGSTWTQQAYLKASNTGAGDVFGTAVAISGESIAVGAPGERSNATGVNGDQNDNSALSSGAVYVFTRTGVVWSQQAYLKASNTQTFDSLGASVAISGNTVIAGAPEEDSAAAGVNGNQADNTAAGSGAAYVFVRSGLAWSQQAYLKASNPNNNDFFGRSVSIDGERAAVGADWEDSDSDTINGDQNNNGANQAGAVYAFFRTGDAWSQEAYLKAFNSRVNALFGIAVSVSGSTVFVGSKWESSNATGVNGSSSNASAVGAGAAYPFVFEGSGGCTYSLSAASAGAPAAGGAASVGVIAGAGCAWTASTNANWITVTSGASGSGPGTVALSIAANPGLPRSGAVSIAGQTFTINQEGDPSASSFPGAGVPNPSFGAGSTGTVTFTFTDGDGIADLSVVNILINDAIDGRNACYLAYIPTQGTLLLVNDGGDASGPFAGVGALPGAGLIGNSQCTVDLGASASSISGNTLTLTLKFSFSTAFGGNRVMYLAARDIGGHNTGWLPRAVWSVPLAGPGSGTSVVGLTPRRASASAATFTAIFSDISGFADLNVINLLINSGIDGRQACYLAFVRSTGQVLLVNDAGDAGGPFAGGMTIPGTGSVANSQCTIQGTGASVSGSGSNLTLTLPISFTGAFAGDRIVYAAARDSSNNNSGWQAMGTITVP